MAGYQSVAQQNLTCAIRIRERRRQLGLTQAEVVDRVSEHGSRLSNQALSAIENGRRLAVGRLPGLAVALDCTVTYLLGLTADPRRWQPDQTDGPVTPKVSSPARVPASGTAAAPKAAGHPRAGRPASSDPARRSWILGPDVPGELRGRAYETGTAKHPC